MQDRGILHTTIRRDLITMKKMKGFTLIELIVVIAIIGVLCALLIPSMMGWMTKSRISTSNSNAKEIYNALNAVSVTFDNSGVTADGVFEVYCRSAAQYPSLTAGESMTVDEAQIQLLKVDKDVMDTSGSTWAAVFEDNKVVSVVYADKSCRYIGGFPNMCPEEKESKKSGTKDITDYLECASSGSEKCWADVK